jgi:hypothetical protein
VRLRRLVRLDREVHGQRAGRRVDVQRHEPVEALVADHDAERRAERVALRRAIRAALQREGP